MMKKSVILAFPLACISVLGATACGARPRRPEVANPMFVDASPLLNTTVEVRGLLRWTFENRNLFPPGTSADHISSSNCLPVLITSDNHAILELAKKKDGRIVTVRGRIVETAPQGMVSVTTCKKVGIEVSSLE